MNSPSIPLNEEVFTVPSSRLSWGEFRNGHTVSEGDIVASYSADRIAQGKPIRTPFNWQGSLWLCVSLAGSGITPSRMDEARAYRLIPPPFFDGDITTYLRQSETFETDEIARHDPLGFYHGIQVKSGKNTFILSGPPATFIPDDNDETSENLQLELF